MPRHIAPTAITAQPISAVVPYGASAVGAMKNPEPTMLPITSAVQVASPRAGCASRPAIALALGAQRGLIVPVHIRYAASRAATTSRTARTISRPVNTVAPRSLRAFQ